MVNRYRPHVWLIPEDDADRELAVGFLNHEAVADRVVGVRAPAGGWHEVLDVFESEYLPQLRRHLGAHVVMLIDFDGDESRRAHFEARIADDVRPRVFVIGSKDDPETLSARWECRWKKSAGNWPRIVLRTSFGFGRIHTSPITTPSCGG